MVVNTSNWESRVSFSLPQYPTASTVQSVPGPSWLPDVEPRSTQPCNPQVPIFFTSPDTKPLKNLPTTVTSNNARYGVSFYDSPDDRLSVTPVVPTSVYTPQPLRETHVNPNLTAIEAVANLRDVLYQGFTLPKRTLRTFDGNPLDYYGFIKSFNATIREQVTEPASQLEYLIDMCTGKAREAIKHLSIVTPPSLGMNQAMETLHNRFGQKHVVVKAHLDSITDGPPVKLDKNSLDNFVTDLTNCQIVMEACNFASELNSSQTLKSVFKRLPVPLQ